MEKVFVASSIIYFILNLSNAEFFASFRFDSLLSMGVGGFNFRGTAKCLPESLICCTNELLFSRIDLHLFLN